jgi:hypothetical protein
MRWRNAVYGDHTRADVIVDTNPNRSGIMYPVGISHSRRERTMDWKTRICVVLAGSWFAFAVTSAASAQEAVDQKKTVVEADQHKAAAEAEGTDATERGANPRERSRAPDAEELATVGTGAPSAPIKPESTQVQQICRKISVTGTRFTRRECMTAEQWAEVNARQSAQGRRVVRDAQSQSSVIGSPGAGGDTPEGRPSGLPNPGGL